MPISPPCLTREMYPCAAATLAVTCAQDNGTTLYDPAAGGAPGCKPHKYHVRVISIQIEILND
jgi:hypothetical protein